jgi:C-terminal processing protease CtpA/Prc
MNIQTNTVSNAGQELYYAIWQKVQERFYDQERLLALNWIEQKHRFDEQITDQASAISYAKILLQMLGDKYTKLVEPTEVVTKQERRVSKTRYATNKLLPGAIGYIGILSFDHKDIFEQVRERLAGVAHCDGFVVDLRGNGGGLLNATANVCELFIDEGTICFIESRTDSGLAESVISFSNQYFERCTVETDKEPEKFLYKRRSAMIAGKPMVILIDGDTASSAEMFTAALLDCSGKNPVVSMGSKSSGKGIGQADFDIFGQVTLTISCVRFFSPANQWFGDAAQTIANGIKPDIYLADNPNPAHAVEIAANYLRAHLEWLGTVALARLSSQLAA